LARRAAWWNPFWVEEYELGLGLWPERCAEMLREALPRWGTVRSAGGGFAGYVDQDEITLYPVWGAGARNKPMMGGRILSEPGGCRIELHVANSNWTIYVLVLWTALFWAVSAALLVSLLGAALGGSVAPNAGFLWIFVFFGIVIPAAFIVILGRPNPGKDARHESNDAKFGLDFLEGTFGTRPVKRLA
jgi:hypothetical protein